MGARPMPLASGLIVATLLFAATAAVLVANPRGQPAAAPARACPRLAIEGPGLRAVPMGGQPYGLAVGERALWVLRFADGTPGSLIRVAPRTGRLLRAGVFFHLPVAVAAGEGAVWVVDRYSGPEHPGGSVGRLLKIDPRSLRVEARITVGRDPSDVAAGLGSVWVANEGDNSVSRIDPVADRVMATVGVAPGPQRLLLGAGGVWVSSNEGQTVLTRLDARSGRVAATMPNLSGLAATTGTVWVEGPGTPNGAVLRLDPATNQVTGRPLGLDIEPAAAVARGGGLWIAKWVSYCSQGDLLPHGPRVIFELMRVNPASMEILGHSFPIARMPVQPVFGAGAIWVADRTGLSLLRIDPHAE